MSVDLFAMDCECGCAAKVPADRLAAILRGVELPSSPDLVVGPETLDDAGVYRLSDDRYLVQTVDFFPPVARDPRTYGRIAAANSLSDVYAMGGEAMTALAIVCFPAKSLDSEVLHDMTAGAADKLKEAEAVLLGGHSVVDDQLKYGLAVTGTVSPDDLMDNAHAKPGDVLILTKAIGTGVTLLAVRAGMASPEQEQAAYDSMATLNRDAARLARRCGVVSCTDVTGFGLLGHAYEMAKASGVSVEILVDRAPKLERALEYAETGLLSAAAYANRQYVSQHVEFAEDVGLAEQDILFDPQTSGGLLVACQAGRADEFLDLANEEVRTPCAVVGKVIERRDETRITVRRS